MTYDLTSLKRQKAYKKDGIEYINIECAFDIETTNTKTDTQEPIAFMYAWCLGLRNENFMYYGRTWEEFLELCRDLKEHFQLNEERRLVCYVHNLAFEFQFMRKYFNWIHIFAPEKRQPLVALNDFGIEFRDSYRLSGSDLNTVANNLAFHDIEKLKGDLDYTLTRHHNTELTAKEWGYIKHDVLILLYYINEQFAYYNYNITKVPYTNTGRVRKYVRDMCYKVQPDDLNIFGKPIRSYNKYNSYKRIMNVLQLTAESYQQCRNAFMGGYVHASARKLGQTLENVTSIDITSSYPAVMVSEKFPMSKPFKVDVSDPDFNFRDYFNNTNLNLVFTIKLINPMNKLEYDYESYISESNCEYISNPITHNGRVFSADELILTITDVDFDVIEKTYEWDEIQFANMYYFYNDYLPKPIIKSIMKLYEDKTQLKGIKGKELEYYLNKSMLNAVYGMTVTDIVKDDVVYDENLDDWELEEANINEKINRYNHDKNRFLYYPWGLFVSAYARRNLWDGIVNIGNDYVYSDTDSIKLENIENHYDFIYYYNNMITEKVQAMCEHYNLDYQRLAPENINGEIKPIGIWEVDGTYSKFKTLGAKRYLVEHKDSKELEITLSGLNKKDGVKYLKQEFGTNENVFENFDNFLYVPDEYSGKLVHYYIEKEQLANITDYQGNTVAVKAPSGLHLEPTHFTLSLPLIAKEIIDNAEKGYIITSL